jgi:pimeloyl-ACP methyl ester carboxylesterase
MAASDLSRKVLNLLGTEMPHPSHSQSETLSEFDLSNGKGQRICLTGANDRQIPGLLLKPQNVQVPGPAILYCHAHGNRYDIGKEELLEGRPALLKPYAQDLLALGFTVLCLDMPCFGERSHLEEGAEAKKALWQGQTLFGQMLADLTIGVNYLCGFQNVDENRIGVMGVSMGGTNAWWLAALDERISAAISLCCFADLEMLVQTGAHDGHGNYMTVPGLLKVARTGELASLIAPRPFIVGAGMKDWSTPPEAFDRGKTDLENAYATKGAETKLTFVIEPEAGHEETLAMRQAVLNFLKLELN